MLSMLCILCFSFSFYSRSSFFFFFLFFFLMIRRPPSSPLFPYPTLFRSLSRGRPLVGRALARECSRVCDVLPRVRAARARRGSVPAAGDHRVRRRAAELTRVRRRVRGGDAGDARPVRHRRPPPRELRGRLSRGHVPAGAAARAGLALPAALASPWHAHG